jgi:hypothetical protein
MTRRYVTSQKDEMSAHRFALPKNETVYQAMLAGGDKKLMQLLQPQLAEEYAVSIDHHWDYKPRDPNKPLPRNLELILVVSSMISPALRDWVEAAAKKAKVPLAVLNLDDWRAGVERIGLEKYPSWAGRRPPDPEVEPMSPLMRQKAKEAAAAAPPAPPAPAPAPAPAPPAPAKLASVTPIRATGEFPRYIGPYSPSTSWAPEDDVTLKRLAEKAAKGSDVIEGFWRDRNEYRSAGALYQRIQVKEFDDRLVPELAKIGRQRRTLRDEWQTKELAEGPKGEWISRDLALLWIGTEARYKLAQTRGHVVQSIDRELDLVVASKTGILEAIKSFGPYRPKSGDPHEPPHLAAALGVKPKAAPEPAPPPAPPAPVAPPRALPSDDPSFVDDDASGATSLDAGLSPYELQKRILRRVAREGKVSYVASSNVMAWPQILALVQAGKLTKVSQFGSQMTVAIAPAPAAPAAVASPPPAPAVTPPAAPPAAPAAVASPPPAAPAPPPPLAAPAAAVVSPAPPAAAPRKDPLAELRRQFYADMAEGLITEEQVGVMLAAAAKRLNQ